MTQSTPIIDLPDIVQSLQNKRWHGTLEVIGKDDDRATFLFFREGIIQHSAPDRNPMVLGQALYQLGLIDEADYVMTMVDYEQTGRRCGEVLVELGLVDQAGIRKALVFQGREHVLDAFTWKNVNVEFHAGDEKLGTCFSDDQREVELNLAGMSVLMEAARRADEWDSVRTSIPSEHDVIAPTANGGLLRGILDRRVGLLVDGYRSAQEIANQAPMNTLEVLKSLAGAIQDGHLRCLDPPALAQVGAVAEQDNDFEKALRVYELAGERGLEHLDLQRRVARVYSQLGRRKEGTDRWVNVAERCVSLDRVDLAISAVQEASALDPQNMGLRRRLGRLLIDAKQTDEAAQVQRGVIDLAEEAGSALELKIEVMCDYLELKAEDKEILERIAALYLEQDDNLQAMERLDDLATVHASEGTLEKAVEVYYQILDIDAENLQARLLAAQSLAKMGSTDDAVREYRRLADILYRSGVIGKAINWPFLIKVYESIVELEPSSTPAWEWLAKAYIENGQEDLAISRYLGMADSLEPAEGDLPPPEMLQPLRRVVELSPKMFDVRRRLAATHMRLHQVDRATRTLRELAESALEDELVDEARDAYHAALEHNPFDVDSRRGLAAIQELQGESEEAFANWRAIGGMCYRAGLLDQAVKDYHRAFQIRDDDADTIRELAEIEEKRERGTNSAKLYARYAQMMLNKGNYGYARRALETAEKLDPSLPQIGELLSRLDPDPVA